MRSSELLQPPKTDIPLGTRLLIYFAVWLLAAAAFQVFLKIEGATETHLNAGQQRVTWLQSAPAMAIVGLAQAFTWPVFPGGQGGSIGASVFLLQAMWALARARRGLFVALTSGQVLLLTIAIINFVRQSRLPSGG